MKNLDDIHILSVESSGTLCGVALTKGQDILCEYFCLAGNQHDRLLATYIDRVIKDFHLKVDSIDAIAVSSGPGSFTGLRIGASIAKALCFNDNPKLIAVPGMKALANAAIDLACILSKKRIFVILESHKSFVYSQLFDIYGNPASEILFCDISELNENEYDDCLIIGSGAKKLNINPVTKYYSVSMPNYLNKLGLKLYKDNIFIKAEDFSPNYYQDFIPKQKS